MYSTSFKASSKQPVAKAPFTPVNQPGSNGGYAPPQSQSGPGQQAPPQPAQRQMYMSQQVAAALTHQQPPPPPSQAAQPGQNASANRGIPPPPQPQQAQNYAPAGSSQAQTGAYIDNMHPYAAPPPPRYPFYPQQYFLANQNHHYDAQQAYLGPTAQTIFPPAPFIYQTNAQWMPPHMHRAQNPPVAAPAPVPQPAQPAQAAAEPAVYPNPSILPASMSYNPYPAYSAPQNQPSYQKREKKQLLIVDPSTKKPINQSADIKLEQDKKMDTAATAASDDIQTQLLRNIKDLQHGDDAEHAVVKQSSRQVTVSVSQLQSSVADEHRIAEEKKIAEEQKVAEEKKIAEEEKKELSMLANAKKCYEASAPPSYRYSHQPYLLASQNHHYEAEQAYLGPAAQTIFPKWMPHGQPSYHTVRNILNKLTPQNILKLTRDLRVLPINTEERLRDSIHIIFEKSLDEQVFSATYAQLCLQLTSIQVPLETEPSKRVSFRTMLLTKCQCEFEKDYIQNVKYEQLIAEADAHSDPAKQAELRELANEKLSKAKRRSLGNIRFIGELFKLEMLTEKIMNDCIERLLKQDTDEENIECLCKLLTTIGKELDKANNANRIKAYFDKLDKIARKKEAVSARIRFMIMDVIDLRKNNWVPRRKDTGPRRIDEIRREADEEKARLEAEQARHQAQGRQKGKYAQGTSKSTSMDSSVKAQNGSMASKIKDVKQITNRNSNELTLGPGGSAGYSWNKPKQADAALPQSASFSAQRRVAEPVARSSLDSKAVKDRLQAVKRMDSADSSQPSSRESSLTRPPSVPAPLTKKTYTHDQIERKTASLLGELVQNKLIAESIKDLDEFCPQSGDQYAQFVEMLVMATLEKNQASRTLLGQFFYVALKDKKLDMARFEQGLKRVIEASDDMSIDVPKISTYLGQIIAPLFNEHFSLGFLKPAIEPVRELRLCAEIIAEALRLASERLGHNTVTTLFKASNLKLDDFLEGVEDKREFIVQNKLEWMNGQNCEKSHSNISVESYETALNQILASYTNNTDIFDQIETKFDERSSVAFIRALVIAVCNSCYSGKIDSDWFKKRSPILKKYIGEKEDLEMEALFAVQALDHRLQHQPGYIRVIFDLLYDEDLIREEVFFKWRNEDKEEGHAISVLSLKQFFEWLSDPDNENLEGANENR